MTNITTDFPYIGNLDTRIGGREENQDNAGFVDTPIGLLLVVCDGMGGGPGGRTASRLAVDTILSFVDEVATTSTPADALIYGINKANEAVYNLAAQQPELHGMGTTTVALLITDRAAYIAHVGDSRLYQLRQGNIVFRTQDHSHVGEMVRAGVLTEEEARNHPRSNVITRAIGIRPTVEVEVDEVDYLAQDRFVLCTDGIWGAMPQDQLVAALTRQASIDEVTAMLVAEVDQIGFDEGGHHDNLTVAILDAFADAVQPETYPDNYIQSVEDFEPLVGPDAYEEVEQPLVAVPTPAATSAVLPDTPAAPAAASAVLPDTPAAPAATSAVLPGTPAAPAAASAVLPDTTTSAPAATTTGPITRNPADSSAKASPRQEQTQRSAYDPNAVTASGSNAANLPPRRANSSTPDGGFNYKRAFWILLAVSILGGCIAYKTLSPSSSEPSNGIAMQPTDADEEAGAPASDTDAGAPASDVDTPEQTDAPAQSDGSAQPGATSEKPGVPTKDFGKQVANDKEKYLAKENGQQGKQGFSAQKKSIITDLDSLKRIRGVAKEKRGTPGARDKGVQKKRQYIDGVIVPKVERLPLSEGNLVGQEHVATIVRMLKSNKAHASDASSGATTREGLEYIEQIKKEVNSLHP